MSRFSVVAVLLLAPSPAFAEVSDKIPSIAQMWIWSIPAMVPALFLAWKPKIGVPLAFLALADAALQVQELLFAPGMYRAVLHEMGCFYVANVWASAATIGLSLIVGTVWRRRKDSRLRRSGVARLE